MKHKILIRFSFSLLLIAAISGVGCAKAKKAAAAAAGADYPTTATATGGMWFQIDNGPGGCVDVSSRKISDDGGAILTMKSFDLYSNPGGDTTQLLDANTILAFNTADCSGTFEYVTLTNGSPSAFSSTPATNVATYPALVLTGMPANMSGVDISDTSYLLAVNHESDGNTYLYTITLPVKGATTWSEFDSGNSSKPSAFAADPAGFYADAANSALLIAKDVWVAGQ